MNVSVYIVTTLQYLPTHVVVVEEISTSCLFAGIFMYELKYWIRVALLSHYKNFGLRRWIKTLTNLKKNVGKILLCGHTSWQKPPLSFPLLTLLDLSRQKCSHKKTRGHKKYVARNHFISTNIVSSTELAFLPMFLCWQTKLLPMLNSLA